MVIYLKRADLSVAASWVLDYTLDSTIYKYKYFTPEETYNKFKLKITSELTIGTMLDDQKHKFGKILLEDGWEEIGWYPSIHDRYKTSYPVYFFAKRQVIFGPNCSLYNSLMLAGGLGCSCALRETKETEVSLAADYNYGPFGSDLGQKRMTIRRWLFEYGAAPVEEFEKLGYRKFATTTEAEYWFFGLKPGEER